MNSRADEWLRLGLSHRHHLLDRRHSHDLRARERGEGFRLPRDTNGSATICTAGLCPNLSAFFVRKRMNLQTGRSRRIIMHAPDTPSDLDLFVNTAENGPFKNILFPPLASVWRHGFVFKIQNSICLRDPSRVNLCEWKMMEYNLIWQLKLPMNSSFTLIATQLVTQEIS